MVAGKRRIILYIAFSIFITIVVLACVELFFRFFPFKRPAYETLFEDIYEVELSMMPNAINPYYMVGLEVLNRYGFRGKDVDMQKPQGVFRIIIIGDSCTYGASSKAEETYPFCLEQFLSQRFSSPKFEVINGGIPGTNIYQNIMVLEKNLLRFNPDMVIVWSSPNFSKVIKEYRDKAENPPWYWSLRRSLHKLALYKQMLRWIKGKPKERASFEVMEEMRKVAVLDENQDACLDDYRRDLIRLKNLSARYGFELVFTDYPSRSNVLEPPKLDGKYNSIPERMLHDFCLENGLLFIDVSSALRPIADESYYADSAHPSPIGNRAIAKVIMESLIKSGKLRGVPIEEPSGSAKSSAVSR